MRTTNIFGAAILALTTSAWSLGAVAQAPAPDTAAPPAADASAPAADASAAPKKHGYKHHAVHKAAYKGKLAPTAAGDKAVDDLNAASLDAAKENKPFTPPATPPAATKAAYKADKPEKHKVHHKAYKKAEKKADDAAAPAAPADTSK